MEGVKNRFATVISESGKSVYEVSMKSGVSQSVLHFYVQNPAHLGRIDTLVRVAKALNVKLWDLLEGESVSGCRCSGQYQN